MTKTLKTLVLKTATVAGVKLTAKTGRIGLVVAQYPAAPLSQGHIPVSHDPEPNADSGSRQERPAVQMREQMRPAGATAGTSGRSAGCLSFPGSSALRPPTASTGHSTVEWRATTKRAVAAGRLAGTFGSNPGGFPSRPARDTSVASFPVVLGLQNRLGCDCQSPDRWDDQRTTTREARYATAAGK